VVFVLYYFWNLKQGTESGEGETLNLERETSVVGMGQSETLNLKLETFIYELYTNQL